MSRAIKERIVKQYATRFNGVADVAVVSTQGIDVLRMTALRRNLRSKGVRALVVQNRLCKVALKGAGLEAASDLLKGPTTLVWGGDTIVDLAKVLAAEAKTVKELQIRGGVSGGQRLSKADMEMLSKMPGRLELLAMVAGTFLGPARRVAAQIMAPARGVAAQIREVEKKAPPAAEAASQPVAEAPKAEGAAPAAEAPKA